MEVSGELHSLAALSAERTPFPVEEEAECTQGQVECFEEQKILLFPARIRTAVCSVRRRRPICRHLPGSEFDLC